MRFREILKFSMVAIIGFLGVCCSLTDMQESREIAAKDFYGVMLDGVGDVNIYYAEDYKVIVNAASKIHDIVVIDVSNNILHIGEKHKNGFNPIKLSVDVYMPELKNIDLKGTGDIKIVNGKTSNFEIINSGKGNIDAQNYEAENVIVNHSGIGNINTWVTKSLTGKHSGIGDILYKGNPSINKIKITGIGKVKKM